MCFFKILLTRLIAGFNLSSLLLISIHNIQGEEVRIFSKQGSAWLSKLNRDSLYVFKSKLIFIDFFDRFKLKRIWVKGGNPSGVGNVSLKVNQSMNDAQTWPKNFRLFINTFFFKHFMPIISLQPAAKHMYGRLFHWPSVTCL